MNQSDFLNAVAKHQPCTSRDLYLPLLEKGYYSTKPENAAIEDIAKYAGYLKKIGLLINEKQARPQGGSSNVWSLAKTETTTEETDMDDHAEMASDIAELQSTDDRAPEPAYITRVTRLAVMPRGHNIFSDMCTNIEIDDEGGGEYIKVFQSVDSFSGIKINPDEWPAIVEAIDMMLTHIEANAPAGA